MLRLLARRLLGLLPILLGVAVLVFFLVRFVPGDPAVTIAGERASPELLAEVRRVHGLDQPLPVQLGRYLAKLAVGDLGGLPGRSSPAPHRRRDLAPPRSSTRT